MSNNSHEESKRKFAKQLAGYTTQKLVSAFNKEVGIWHMGITRQAYLSALRMEFYRRQVDLRLIVRGNSMAFGHVVYLKNNKLHRLEDLLPVEVVVLFDNYLSHKHPDHLALKPKIIAYDNRAIRYTLSGQKDSIALEANQLVKSFITE